jgi:hypothetical protein
MRTLSRTYGLCLLLAAASAGGCLRKDVTHTLYLAPTDVTWSVVESGVRSDETDPAARWLEEQDYLLAARAGRHGVARALGAAGATRVGTLLVRSDRPFTVITEGHFTDLAGLARSVIRRAGARGDATIERDGCRQTFRAWVDPSQDANGDDLADLVTDLSAYRLVLTDGRFLDARGFTIVEDGTVAIPVETVDPEDGLVRISLSWNEGWCYGGRS